MKYNSVLLSAGILALCPLLSLADPTFTFGPASNYAKSSAAVTPTGSTMLISPTSVAGGIPAGGIDFAFGPDQQKAMKDAISGVCKSGVSQDCINTMAGIIDNKQTYAIQARIVGIDDLFALSLVALISAIVLGSQLDSQPASVVHFESSDLAQIQSQTAAPYVFVTKTGSPPITITSLQTPTPTASSASITTLTADGNGHHKGDILVNIGADSADIMLQLFNMVGGHEKCKNGTSSSKKRGSDGAGVNLVGISNAAQFVLMNADPHGPLAGLGLGGQQNLPALANTANQLALGILQSKALAMPAFAGVAQSLVHLIAEAVFIAAYEVCANAASDLSELVIEEWFYDDRDNSDDEPSSCPKDVLDMPDCSDPACAGNGGKTDTAVGSGKCTTGDNKGCKCLGSVTPFWSYGGQDLWSNGQAEIGEMLSGASPSPGPTKLTCGSNTDMGNAVNYVDLDMINNAANNFCQRQINNKVIFNAGSPNQKTEFHYNNHLYDPVYVSLEWTDGPNCPTMDFTHPTAMDTCRARLGSPIDGCDTYNPSGLHWWKQGGSLYQDCLTWTIKRDTWNLSTYLGPISTDPNWKPKTNTCKSPADCPGSAVPAACQTQFGGMGYCYFDTDYTDLGWCKCT